jgi:hypothetical protein
VKVVWVKQGKGFDDFRALWRWALGVRRRTQEDPTFRQAARRFRCSLDTIEIVAEDAKNYGLGDITVAYGIPGVGHGAEMARGDWEFEPFEEVDA